MESRRSVEELVPKIPYSDIRAEVEAGRVSERMGYCGQEGFNITRLPESDLERVLELTSPTDSTENHTTTHPDESLKSIATDYFEDDSKQ